MFLSYHTGFFIVFFSIVDFRETISFSFLVQKFLMNYRVLVIENNFLSLHWDIFLFFLTAFVQCKPNLPQVGFNSIDNSIFHSDKRLDNAVLKILKYMWYKFLLQVYIAYIGFQMLLNSVYSV